MAQGAADAAGSVASSRCNTIYEHSDGAASDHPSLRGRALYLKGHPRNASSRGNNVGSGGMPVSSPAVAAPPPARIPNRQRLEMVVRRPVQRFLTGGRASLEAARRPSTLVSSMLPFCLSGGFCGSLSIDVRCCPCGSGGEGGVFILVF